MYNLVMTETSITASIRTSQAAQVLLAMYADPKLTKKAACEQVGISPQVFQYWVERGEDTIEALREIIGTSQRDQLSTLLLAKHRATELLSKDATDALTTPKDRVLIMEYIDGQIDELQRALHARPGVESEAQEFLRQGPVIEKKQSRFASVDVQRTDDGVTINLYKEDDVIDATAKDSSPDIQEEIHSSHQP